MAICEQTSLFDLCGCNLLKNPNYGGDVLNDRYHFLFPYEAIPHGTNILIYGAGQMGQEYLRQIALTDYCHVVGVADRNFAKYEGTSVPVYAPTDIHALSFDFVVLAIQAEGSLSEVKRLLIEQGVQNTQIVYVGLRKSNKRLLWQNAEKFVTLQEYSPNADAYMAFRIVSAMGSLFFVKWLVVSIVKYLPSCAIDLYSDNLEEETRFFFSDMPQVKRYINNLGYRYERHQPDYDIAMNLFGGGYVQIDKINKHAFANKHDEFLRKLDNFQANVAQDDYLPNMPRIGLFQLRKFQGRNCYTAMGYSVFGDESKKISLPMPIEARKRFLRLKLSRYITVNYGNGSSKDESLVAKTWPLTRFTETVQKFKQIYPDIEVVQLGARFAEKIIGADCYILGEDFALVEQILQHAVFHLDIEGGLVHLATQLGTKCIVLFGPTPEFYYGYEQNINIKVGDCHDCCGVYLDHNRCARNLAEPPCMYGITSELVLKHIIGYMDSLSKKD